MDGAPSRPSLLVGRTSEQRYLAEVLKSTASGQPCAVVVHGEAGAGKTRLVREACDLSSAEVQMLWGTCVHFGEASVPFAPVTGAIQSWMERADAQERAEVLSGAGELGTVLPVLGTSDSAGSGRLLPLIDLVFNRLADKRPTVVVIDDLQWADRTSLDVLAYLITGFRRQRLALLATCRDEHRGEGHPLHGWLADMRRMPLFSDIHLDRLDLTETETQIQGLLGRGVDIELAAQVHERSAGNPYLTELLVGPLSGDETELPAAAPAALRDALLASWHGLSAEARQATRVLAVGGRPADVELLAGVAAAHGVEPGLLPGCLTEAQDHGVVRFAQDGRPWFRHPLLAEVLYDAMPPADAARVHATYVRVLQSLPVSAPGRAADLAVHNRRAGSADETYRWSVAAADQAAVLRAAGEEAVHLERACSLWDEVSPDVRGPASENVDLLRRASEVCGRVGRVATAIDLAGQALELVDADQDPLLKSTLLLARRRLSLPRPALAKAVDSELIEALRLTEAFPDSSERAQALAALAVAEQWDSLYSDAVAHANEAVLVARRSGSVLALAVALSARALAHVFTDGRSLADAEEAERLARSCGSTEWLVDAATWRVHSLTGLGRTDESTTVALSVFEEVRETGSGYLLAGLGTMGLLDLGRWEECRRVLRTALAARPGGRPGASIRLTAAQLAIRQGRLREARLHVDRAFEVMSGDFTGLRGLLTLVHAEVLIESGEPQQALRWLQRDLLVPEGVATTVDDDRLPSFANAAAEAAQAARDVGDDEGVAWAIAALDDLLDKWPTTPYSEERLDPEDAAVLKAVFEAEVARCKGEPHQAELWQRVIDTSRVAGFPWDQTVASVRCAEAMLAAGAPASEASGLLRDAHRHATALGAEPLRHKVETLARLARVDLREPMPLGNETDPPAALAGLTAREREILAFLVAGRSNGEIARALVLSIKTVSVHVSNILRKTGTSSRVEAAALAERLGATRRS
ncbi:helix-turn-helix transcriptional regulator [Kribbella sp. NPDC055071]